MRDCGCQVHVKWVAAREKFEVSVYKISDPSIHGVFYFQNRLRAYGARKACVDEVLGLGRVFRDKHKNLGNKKFMDKPGRSGVKRHKRWSEI